MNTKDDTTAVSTSVADLAKKVKLPFEPSAVRWVEKRLGGSESDTIPGSTDYVLIAELKFDEEGKKKLLEALGSNERSPGSIDVESWFSDEVKAKQIDRNGYKILTNTDLGADAFLQRPYSGGTLIQIPDTNFFILKLSTV